MAIFTCRCGSVMHDENRQTTEVDYFYPVEEMSARLQQAFEAAVRSDHSELELRKAIYPPIIPARQIWRCLACRRMYVEMDGVVNRWRCYTFEAEVGASSSASSE